jgi:hypothetical protein
MRSVGARLSAISVNSGSSSAGSDIHTHAIFDPRLRVSAARLARLSVYRLSSSGSACWPSSFTAVAAAHPGRSVSLLWTRTAGNCGSPEITQCRGLARRDRRLMPVSISLHLRIRVADLSLVQTHQTIVTDEGRLAGPPALSFRITPPTCRRLPGVGPPCRHLRLDIRRMPNYGGLGGRA